MHFQEHQPPSYLKPYVRYYWTLELDAMPVSPSSQRLLAESFEFMFNLSAPIEFINCDGRIKQVLTSGITGPMSRPMKMRSTGPVSLFGICFKPGGGYPFFNYPAHELANQSPNVGDLWGSKGREFVDYVHNECATTRSRLETVNAYLTQRLTSTIREDCAIQKAIETIQRFRGCITIDQLARRLGSSRRHLTRKFKARIGMSPKQLCRNIRFKHVYKLIEASPPPDWADLALTCGYYDQSHLINEFKYFTGCSPDAYFFSAAHRPDFFTANF
jgi:AraC-like DNA-binding protein